MSLYGGTPAFCCSPSIVRKLVQSARSNLRFCASLGLAELALEFLTLESLIVIGQASVSVFVFGLPGRLRSAGASVRRGPWARHLSRSARTLSRVTRRLSPDLNET